MRIDSRTSAAITLETGLSGKAIRDSLNGKTNRESTRLAILGAAKRLGLSQVEAHVAQPTRRPSIT